MSYGKLRAERLATLDAERLEIDFGFLTAHPLVH